MIVCLHDFFDPDEPAESFVDLVSPFFGYLLDRC